MCLWSPSYLYTVCEGLAILSWFLYVKFVIVANLNKSPVRLKDFCTGLAKAVYGSCGSQTGLKVTAADCWI